jgi:mRNA interferase RelE/StbE
MGSYRIEWRESTKKDLRRIGPQGVRRVIAAVEQLAENPFPAGCQKLRGSTCAYRIRVGDYRVLYEVFQGMLIVEVVRVGHRRDVYRR